MLLNFPNGVVGWANIAKVEVLGVLGFACVLRLDSCSALHSYSHKRISFPAPPRSTGLQVAMTASFLWGRFSLRLGRTQWRQEAAALIGQ